jgi:hypothetical protein
MKRLVLFFLLIFLIPIFYCQKLKGEFAFKLPEDKGYKLLLNKFEFSSTEEVDWIYRFDSVSSDRTEIGVIIFKKEIGWIDILTLTDYIDSEKNIIYGKLKDFAPGDYKIVLVQTVSGENKIIDEVEIYLYSDEDVLD